MEFDLHILKISGKVTNKTIENGLEKKSKSLLEEGYKYFCFFKLITRIKII